MKSKQKGLTLVELMVTLAVAIILLAVGMPLFSGVVANNRATSEANMFLAGFKLARSEAIKRAAQVSVCAIDNPDASPLVCGDDNGDWVNGLLVFTDGSTAGTVDGTDERVKAFVNQTGGATVTTTATSFAFGPLGDSVNATLQLARSGSTGTQTRCLTVRASGQVRLERAACP